MEFSHHKQPQVLITSAPSMESLKKTILSYTDSSHFKEGIISWKNFEDGFPNLMIENIESFRGSDVVFLADFLDIKDIFAQLAVIYALPKYHVRSLTVVLPYFPTGTMERVDTEGQIATAYTLATLFSAISLTSTGPAKLVIYDIHALQERFYFHNNIIPILETAVPLFLEKLKESHKGEKIAIAFPDDGARKRFHTHFTEFPLILCNKTRRGDKRIVEVAEGDVEGYHVFIVDDLVKTGGTLLDCKRALFKNGASKVSAFVTHAIFPLESWKRFTYDSEDSQSFSRFYTTDSCPQVTDIIKEHTPFEILSLGKSIYDCLQCYSS